MGMGMQREQIPSNSFSTKLFTFSNSSSLLTSNSTVSNLALDLMLSLAAFRFEALLSQIITFMPRVAHFWASARPIPEAPPVMTARLPLAKTGCEDEDIVVVV